MFKLLFIGTLIYYAYRMFFSAPALDDRSSDYDEPSRRTNNDHDDEGDYVDYEEIP